MNRRRLLAGLGAVTGAGSLAMGSGAFTSVRADRSVTVDVAGDSQALLALDPVLHDVTGSDIVTERNGQLTIDVTQGGASGVNVDATTWIGTPHYDDPRGWVSDGDDWYDNWEQSDDSWGSDEVPIAAFAVANHGTQTYELALRYEFESEPANATIAFHVYDGSAALGGWIGPHVYGSVEFPTAGPEAVIVPISASNTDGTNFTPGKRVFASIEIDTHGASAAEDLSGQLSVIARRPDE